MPSEYAARKRVKRWKDKAESYRKNWIGVESQLRVYERQDALSALRDLYYADSGADCGGCTRCSWCLARARARKVLFPDSLPGLSSWVGVSGVKFTGEGGVKRAPVQPFVQGEQGKF